MENGKRIKNKIDNKNFTLRNFGEQPFSVSFSLGLTEVERESLSQNESTVEWDWAK